MSRLGVMSRFFRRSGNPEGPCVPVYRVPPRSGCLHLLIAFYARSGQIPVRQDTDHHAQIFEAVRAGDAEAARLAMQGHLQWVRDRL